LLVENDPDHLALIKMLFVRQGCVVETAAHGEEGLAKYWAAVAAKQLFDLIVTDLAMSPMDGKTMTARIRSADAEAGRRTKIVSYTAHGDVVESVLSAEEASMFDDILRKPDGADRFPDMVRVILLEKAGGEVVNGRGNTGWY
jgi:CheY-like chemotaxis protein